MASKKMPRTRKVGFIHLTLVPPDKGSETWTLEIDRRDPYGGAGWQSEFFFEDASEAKRWFRTIQGDEDLDLLWRQAEKD